MNESKNFDLKDFDAILFDWDGVIFDSLAAIAKSTVAMCQKYGVCIDEDYYHKHFTLPPQNFYIKLGIEFPNPGDFEKFNDEFWRVYEKDRLTCSLYPDAPDVLRALATKVKMGIVSASRAFSIHENLKAYGLDNLFEESDIYSRRTHKMNEIGEFCKKYSLSPDRVIMLGDLPSDIEHGKEAGIKTGGVARRPENAERLRSHNPDYIFHSLQELLN